MCFLSQLTFRSPIRYQHDKELMVAAEGMYTGQVCASSPPNLQLPPRIHWGGAVLHLGATSHRRRLCQTSPVPPGTYARVLHF